eukprot:TRINITY_DN13631_c0_g2_i1.p1 TRINITY_DN13631_c0_g2~~TRINITY_DN13631_c0_g2_i1.p1  ORF type:complete len:508 (-),score=87.20 TRINITY_DN13631_c0_g2_i1:262-1674(-)
MAAMGSWRPAFMRPQSSEPLGGGVELDEALALDAPQVRPKQDGTSSESVDPDDAVGSVRGDSLTGTFLIDEGQAEDDRPPVRAMSLVFLSIFQAYAAMQNLQFLLKKDMGVGQSGDRAYLFTDAVTMLHVGKLLSRVGHSMLCGCVSSVTRVYIAMTLVLLGTLVPPIFILWLRRTSLIWVFVTYGLTGVGIGIFEATFLAVITPLGRRTKYWAILGIPIGFVTIGVPGMYSLGWGLPAEALYFYSAACIVLSFAVVRRWAPRRPVPAAAGAPGVRVSEVRVALKAWRTWLPLLLPHVVGKMFVNFGMENLFPVIGFTFNADSVPLFGPERNDVLMSKNNFQALENVWIFFGDTFSRKVPYLLPKQRYRTGVAILIAAMLCEVVAILLTKFAVAWVAWISMFLAFWGNGLVYAVGSRHIDKEVKKEHQLLAYSLWCAFGDVSSVVGAKSQDLVRSWICGGAEFLYECRPQ